MNKWEIWLVDIPWSWWHEQQGKRPVVIIAELEANIAIIVPFTSNMKALRFPHVIEISPNKINGLTTLSIALIFQLRAIDKNKLIKKIGIVDKHEIITIDDTIKSMLKL